MIALIITLIALLGTMFICMLSAHKADVWEETYKNINEKSNSKK